MLTVKAYLSQKYLTSSPTTMTLSEAQLFDIPYPLQEGWLEDYGSQVLTDEIIDRLKRCLIVQSHRGGSKARWAKSGLSVLGCSVELFGD